MFLNIRFVNGEEISLRKESIVALESNDNEVVVFLQGDREFFFRLPNLNATDIRGMIRSICPAGFTQIIQNSDEVFIEEAPNENHSD